MGSHAGCSIIPGGIPPGTHLGSQVGLAYFYLGAISIPPGSYGMSHDLNLHILSMIGINVVKM